MKRKAIINIFDKFLPPKVQQDVLTSFDYLSREKLFHPHKLSDKNVNFSYRYNGFPIFGLDPQKTPALVKIFKSSNMKGFRRFSKILFAHIQNNHELFQLSGFSKDFEVIAMSATEFKKGHFLTKHTDGTNNDYAFVYYPETKWNASWGGSLVFLDENQKLASLCPCGNQLVIFRVPQDHLIEKVKVNRKRIAISGWIKFQRKK